MARPWLRRTWKRLFPQVLMAGVALMCILVLYSLSSIAGTSAPALMSNQACTRHQLQGMTDIRSFWAENCILEFPDPASPTTSVVMLMHNRVAETFLALRSVVMQVTQAPFELILVDDASTDDTPRLISRIRGARTARFERSMRYARANNYAVFNMSSDDAEYVLLLNNDIEMLSANTYSSLVNLLNSHQEAGAAGCKIVLLDGKLQEAGSLVWRDGSALGYGRGEEPSDPKYNFVRAVDYCSGACLMVRRDIYRRLGGFDVARFPMYYEDTDLQLKIRYMEKRSVLYQPQAVIRHHEYGSSSRAEAVSMMKAAHKVFQQQWHDRLTDHFPHGAQFTPCASNRADGMRFLWIAQAIPDDPLSPMWMRTLSIIGVLRSQGHVITMYPLVDQRRPVYTEVLQQQGVEVGGSMVMVPGVASKQAFLRFLQDHPQHFDAVVFGDFVVLQHALSGVRTVMPGAFLVANVETLMWHRGEHSEMGPSSREVDLYAKCRHVWLPSARDLSVLQGKLAAPTEVLLVQYSVAGNATSRSYLERRAMGFYADFDSVDQGRSDIAALTWFLKEVWPLLNRDLRDLSFIVGHRTQTLPQGAATLIDSVPGVKVRHGVTLDAFYNEVRVHVLPHTSGEWATVRLLEALSRGVPSVAQARWVGALGVSGEDYGVLGVDSAEEMADSVLRLWSDEIFWAKLRDAAQFATPRRFGESALEANVLDAVSAIPRTTCKR